MSWYSVFALVLTTTAVTWGAENCDHLGVLLYEDLGCTPDYGDSKAPCPVKYSCNGLSKSPDHCYFKGKAYKLSEQIDNSLTAPNCAPSCFCSKYNNEAKFQCAILDCPQWLGSPLKPDCYRKYELGKCCSSGEICPPFDNLAKCTVDGKEYREGEKFYPKDECLECVCKKGFAGKLEAPFCERLSCGIQLRRGVSNIHDSCAPLYDKGESKRCCPDGWVCPSGTEEIKGDGKTEDVCKFGDKTLKVGQSFEKSNVENDYGRTFNKIECECVIPPFLTCHETE